MKHYTSSKQTAKLIELGLEKPKTPISYSYPDPSEKQKEYEASLGLGPYLATVDQIEFEYAYSIGELIEILPIRCLTKGLDYRRVFIEDGVFYYDQKTGSCIIGFVDHRNLIDNIFDAILRLKEEGVI